MKRTTIYMTCTEFMAYSEFLNSIRRAKFNKKKGLYEVIYPKREFFIPLFDILRPQKEQRHIAVKVKDAVLLITFLKSKSFEVFGGYIGFEVSPSKFQYFLKLLD